MEKLTSRDRVITAMRRRAPDRVPVDLSWGMTVEALERFRSEAGAENPEDYFGLDVRYVDPELAKGWGKEAGVDSEGSLDPAFAEKERAFRRYLGDLAPGTTITEWGVGHQREGDSHYVRFVHPLCSANSSPEILAFPFPSFDEPWRIRRLERAIGEHHARGLAVCGALGCTIFETSWMMRGMERLLEDMMIHPQLAAALFDQVTAIRCTMAQRLAQLGVDVLVLGDDIASQQGMMMSPAMWREWLRPRLSQVITAARTIRDDVLIFYHSDGNPSAIIPDLIEIGIDILNPVQPECMDPAALKLLYGDRLSFWGTLGTQSTMPFGTPKQVKDEVRRRMETVGTGGGLLLGPTHSLQGDVPWANIIAFFEAVEEYGKYE